MCGAILTFVKTPSQPARVLHKIRECRVPGLHRKSVFACVSNVQAFDIDVMKFSKDLLEPASPVSIHKDVTAHFASLGAAAAGQPKMFGPFDHTTDAALREEDHTRNSLFLPATLVPFVIDNAMTAGETAEVLMVAKTSNLSVVTSSSF